MTTGLLSLEKLAKMRMNDETPVNIPEWYKTVSIITAINRINFGNVTLFAKEELANIFRKLEQTDSAKLIEKGLRNTVRETTDEIDMIPENSADALLECVRSVHNASDAQGIFNENKCIEVSNCALEYCDDKPHLEDVDAISGMVVQSFIIASVKQMLIQERLIHSKFLVSENDFEAEDCPISLRIHRGYTVIHSAVADIIWEKYGFKSL